MTTRRVIKRRRNIIADKFSIAIVVLVRVSRRERRSSLKTKKADPLGRTISRSRKLKKERIVRKRKRKDMGGKRTKRKTE